jgi:hypothetical protein
MNNMRNVELVKKNVKKKNVMQTHSCKFEVSLIQVFNISVNYLNNMIT